jgi:uracil-DNA glycosylase
MRGKADQNGRSAREFLPARKTYGALAEAVQGCRGCDLYKNATQAVFGDGSKKPECMLIGEQPGNEEDLQGKPFVGPAGRMLAKALEDAGITTERVYTTNAVKHFKNEIRGKRRLHRSPNRAEIVACRPWLEEEVRTMKPQIIVCMGVSAAVSVFEKAVTLKALRGGFVASPLGPRTLVTVHPSSILRAITSEDRRRNYADFVADLRLVAKELK